MAAGEKIKSEDLGGKGVRKSSKIALKNVLKKVSFWVSPASRNFVRRGKKYP